MTRKPTKTPAPKPGKKPAADIAPPKKAKALAAFAKDFLADLPPEAAGGSYGPSVRDRWHGQTFKIPGGDHEASGWTFTFANGALIHARLTAAAAT